MTQVHVDYSLKMFIVFLNYYDHNMQLKFKTTLKRFLLTFPYILSIKMIYMIAINGKFHFEIYKKNS